MVGTLRSHDGAMRRSKVLISLVFLLLLAGACGDDSGGGGGTTTEPTDGGETVELDAGATEAEVAVGDTVEVDIEENASVGDDWRFAEDPDDDVLELVDERFELEGEEGCAGCGGTVTFVFEAVGEGEAAFTLANCFRCTSEGEPSETPPEPAELEFTVVVSG